MDTWEIFLKRSEQDLKISKLCFDEHDYELQSYLLQQTLEKAIKAYLLKNKTIENPEELQHLPLHRIFNIMKEDMKKRRRQHTENKSLLSSYEQGIALIEKLTTLFDDIKRQPKKSETKIPIWKNSLQIPLTSRENGVYKKWEKEFQPIAERGFHSLRKMAEKLTDEDYKKIEKASGIKKEQLEKFVSLIPDEALSKNVANLDPEIPEEFVKLGMDLQKQYEKSSVFLKNHTDELSSKILEPLLFIIDLKNIIVETIVHEDIGRYPIKIDGKTSTDWYSERQYLLKDLSNRVENTCLEIKKRMN